MHAPRLLARAIAGALAFALTACGSSTDSPASNVGGAAGATGGVAGSAAGGKAGSGGATSPAGGSAPGGAAGSGGSPATGGVSGASTSGGAGGSSNDAGAGGAGGSLDCWSQPGVLVPEAKICNVSADCEAVPTYSCCGPGPLIGLAIESGYRACLTTTAPSDCPPLGCSSTATVESGGPVEGGYYTPAALARCVGADDGTKACATTACTDHSTECDPGDTCTNGCGMPCTCVGGALVCDHPGPGTTCTDYISCSYRDTLGAPATEICVCSASGTVCTPTNP